MTLLWFGWNYTSRRLPERVWIICVPEDTMYKNISHFIQIIRKQGPLPSRCKSLAPSFALSPWTSTSTATRFLADPCTSLVSSRSSSSCSLSVLLLLLHGEQYNSAGLITKRTVIIIQSIHYIRITITQVALIAVLCTPTTAVLFLIKFSGGIACSSLLPHHIPCSLCCCTTTLQWSCMHISGI